MKITKARAGTEPATPVNDQGQDAVGRLNDVLSARRARLADADGGLSAPLVGLVILGSFVILGYAILVGSRSAGFHMVGASAIALVLGFSVVILMAYNFPYSGSLAVDPAPFRSGVLLELLTGKPSRGRANETTGAAGRDRGVGDGLTGPPRVTRWKGEG